MSGSPAYTESECPEDESLQGLKQRTLDMIARMSKRKKLTIGSRDGMPHLVTGEHFHEIANGE